MFEGIPLDVIIPFGFFALFLFYQSRYASSGSLPPSGPGNVMFSISIGAGGICNVAFLLYVGWQVRWWAPFLLIALFIPFLIFGVIMERIITPLGWALLGFIGWPLCAYMMFSNIP
jgi:hypothetical protein